MEGASVYERALPGHRCPIFFIRDRHAPDTTFAHTHAAPGRCLDADLVRPDAQLPVRHAPQASAVRATEPRQLGFYLQLDHDLVHRSSKARSGSAAFLYLARPERGRLDHA